MRAGAATLDGLADGTTVRRGVREGVLPSGKDFAMRPAFGGAAGRVGVADFSPIPDGPVTAGRFLAGTCVRRGGLTAGACVGLAVAICGGLGVAWGLAVGCGVIVGCGLAAGCGVAVGTGTGGVHPGGRLLFACAKAVVAS